MAELEQRGMAALAHLHRCLDDDALIDVARLNGVIVGLSAERDIPTRISTRPWRAGTFAGFPCMVDLPIVLFLLYLVLASWVGS